MDKILGSMASADCSFDEIMTLGTAVGVSLVTISAGLDHCHVPGRTTAYGAIEGDTLEIGMGIHNEPGVRTVTPIPPIDDLIAELLQYLIDPNDADRAYVPFQKTDEIVVLINNLGGVSTLELRAATQATIAGLKTIHGIVPSRVVAGTFMTSLNAPAFAITLLNITHAARESGVDASQILEYFDAPTDALSWPKTAPYSADAAEEEAIEDESEKSFAEDITVNPATLERKLRKACENIIEIEPKLTEWDTEMGDGDCGETIKAGAVALLDLLDSGLAKTGSILRVVDAMVDITEDHMGGTLGAVFGIFFAALMSALVAAAGKPDAPIEQVLATATAEALASLRTHTPAKEGDRTVMDVMIPFSAAFDGGNVEKAAKAAKEAAEGTMKLMPKLGRATYVGGLAGRDLLPPDPGAWGVHELIQGLAE